MDQGQTPCIHLHSWRPSGLGRQYKVTLSNQLTWTSNNPNNTSQLVKKGQQRSVYLRKLKWDKLPLKLLNFCRSTVKSILTNSITVHGTSAAQPQILNRLVKANTCTLYTTLISVTTTQVSFNRFQTGQHWHFHAVVERWRMRQNDLIESSVLICRVSEGCREPSPVQLMLRLM